MHAASTLLPLSLTPGRAAPVGSSDGARHLSSFSHFGALRSPSSVLLTNMEYNNWWDGNYYEPYNEINLNEPPYEPPYWPNLRKICWYNCRYSSLKQNAAIRVLCKAKLEEDVDDETCELVNGIELVIGEGQDCIRAYLLKAVKNNNGTGVLLLSDIFGFEDSSTRDFAYRVACNGYNVLVPDLFRGDPWKKGRPQTEFEFWLTRQSPSRVAIDIDECTNWLVDELAAAGISRKIGIIGFCFGGGKLIETLARDKQASFGTGICFYGTRIDTSLAADIRVPILLICGDNDHLCPISTLREMEEGVEGSRLVIYSGRGHGFAHRPESQEEDADAEDAFAVMRNCLQDCLVLSKNHVM